MSSHRANAWEDAELAILHAHPEMSTRELTAWLPGRTARAIGNKRKWCSEDPVKPEVTPLEVPPVKPPGEYVETLSAYFAQDCECLDIWLKWNGYVTCRELCRDMRGAPLGIVTLLCTAKS